ncbi:hypothetical protein ACWEOH_04970 [Agromyces sp. NPDC004153]
MSLPRAVALVPAALGVLLFTGCAGGAVAEEVASSSKAPEPTTEAVAEQTVAEACAVLVDGAEGFMAFSSGDVSAAMEDPAGTASQLQAASEAFALAVQGVTNPEVQPIAVAADETMQAYVVYLDGLLTDPAHADVSALGTHVDAITSSFTAIGEVCA